MTKLPVSFSLSLVLFFLVPLLQAEPPEWSGNPDQTIEINMLPGMMRYDLDTIDVEPGARIKLALSNPDDLEHNWVLLENDPEDPKAEKFAMDAMTLGADGPKMAWVPDSPRVLAKSEMIGPKKDTVVYFEAPKKAGTYLYLCSFPGHATLMRGNLRVGLRESPLENLTLKVYEGDFYKLPQFADLEPVREGAAEYIDLDDVEDPEKPFAAVWEGSFEIKKAGRWEFILGSINGSRLSINGEAVVDNDGVHVFRVKKGTEKLEVGRHDFRLTHFGSGDAGQLSLMAHLKSDPKMFFSKDISVDASAPKKELDPILIDPGKRNEPIVHRTFLSATQPRGIGVGFPEKAHLAWNADTMNLEMVWRGGFMDVAPHWTGRGSKSRIAGFDQVTPVSGMAFQILESLDEPWKPYSRDQVPYERDKPPAEIKKNIEIGVPHPDYDFRGYRLDADRVPVFQYGFNAMDVEDTFDGSLSDGIETITRKLTISGEVEENTYLLLGDQGSFEDSGDGWLDMGQGLLAKVNGMEPVIRESIPLNSVSGELEPPEKKRTELLLPITKPGTVEIVYRWKTPVSGRQQP